MKYRILLLLSFLMMASAGWGQTDLAGWTFPSAPISSSTIIAAECGEFQSSANIYMDGSNGSSTFTNITGFAGHAPNATYQVCNVSTATQALAIVGDTNNNKGIVFKFPTTGYEDLKLSYSTRGTNAGYGTHVWSYSTNGTSFTNISTITGRKSTSFSTQTVDFSSVAALDNQAYVYIKVTISGATDSVGNNRFDNIKFYATEAVTADPIITLSNNGTQVTAGNVEQSTQNHILSTFKLDVTDAGAELNEAYFTTSGTYQAADVDGFKLWYNNSNNFATANQLGSTFASTSTGSGDLLEFNGLSQSINEDATGYFWVTADVSASATTGRTVSLDAVAGADFEFTSGNATGNATAGGLQTITVNTSPAFVIENVTNNDFGNVCTGETSSITGSFDFYGMNLTGNVTIGPLTGYSFSTDNINFSPSLTLVPDGGGDISEEIYIRFSPVSAESYNGNVSITGGGATPTSVAVTGTGISAPTISAHPADQSVTTGTAATFSVTATGATSYQWQLNTGSGWSDITDATSFSYTTENTTLTMNGYHYRVILTNDCGDTTSNPATLTVTDGPCYVENFDSGTRPSGWIDSGGNIAYSSFYANMEVNSGTITTAAFTNNPSSLKFDLARTGNDTNKTLLIQVSTTSQTSGFTTVATYDHSNTTSGGTTEINVDLSAYSSASTVYIRFNKTSSTTSPWRIDNIEIICGESTPAYTHFRSQANGNWTSSSTWESSSDGVSWADATSYPGASAENVVILTDHTVEINSSAVVVTNTTVYGTIEVTTTGAYSVQGDEEIELTIEDGGVFLVSSPGEFSVTNGNAFGLVKTGGKVVAGPGMGASSGTAFVNAYLGYESGLFYFGDAAICEWANPHTTLGSQSPDPGNRNFFYPYEEGDMPIFRVTATPSYPFGANTYDNIFHSIIEIIEPANFTLVNNGTKTFVGGVSGNGELIMANSFDTYDSCGPVIIGNSSIIPILDGTATIVTNSINGRLRFPNGVNVPAHASFTIENIANASISFQRNGGLFNIDGILDITNQSITNTSSGGISVNNGGTIRTRHTGGLFGDGSAIPSNTGNLTLNTGSTVEYYADENQSISSGKEYYHLVFSGSGTKEPENQTDVHDLGSITITGDPVVDYSENNLGLTIINDTNFTMDGGKLIIGTGGTQPRPGGTYNLTGGAIEFTGNSNTDIKVTPTYHDIIISGTNKTPGGIDFKINNILSVTSTGELTIPSTPDTENPNVVTAKKGVQVETGGELVFENNANLMQDAGADNSGNITQLRNANVPSNQYNYWASPVQDQPLYSLYDDGLVVPTDRVMVYNPETDYFKILKKNNNPKSKFGEGYSIKGPASNPSGNVTAKFIGTPNNESATENTITVETFTTDGDNNNYNLIGNPFPSNMDLVKFYDDDNDNNPATGNAAKFETADVYFWDNIGNTEIYQQGSGYSQSNYAIYNMASKEGNPAPCYPNTECTGSSGKTPNGIVKPGQGFIINVKQGGTSLTVNNDMRTTAIKINAADDDAEYYKNGNQFAANDTYKRNDKFRLEFENPKGVKIQTVVGYFEEAENTFERFDSKILSESVSDNVYTLSHDNVKLAIQGRKGKFHNDDEIPLGVKLFEEGKYKIGLVQTKGIFISYQDIYLKDKFLGVIHNLSDDGLYDFEGLEGEFNDRFEIVFKDGSTPSGPVLTTASQNKINILKRDNQIEISSSKDKITKVEIFDLAGWPVYKNSQVNSKVLRIPALSFDKQIIVVKIETETGEIQTKKFVNK